MGESDRLAVIDGRDVNASSLEFVKEYVKVTRTWFLSFQKQYEYYKNILLTFE